MKTRGGSRADVASPLKPSNKRKRSTVSKKQDVRTAPDEAALRENDDVVDFEFVKSELLRASASCGDESVISYLETALETEVDVKYPGTQPFHIVNDLLRLEREWNAVEAELSFDDEKSFVRVSDREKISLRRLSNAKLDSFTKASKLVESLEKNAIEAKEWLVAAQSALLCVATTKLATHEAIELRKSLVNAYEEVLMNKSAIDLVSSKIALRKLTEK